MKLKLEDLFVEEKVKKILEERLPELYPSFSKIKRLKIKEHKNHVGGEYYRIVLEYLVYFAEQDGTKSKKIHIFCSAYSGCHNNLFCFLKFIWDSGFNSTSMVSARPLFYLPELKATFYRGLVGETLIHYVKNQDWNKAKQVSANAGRWLAKLHKIPVKTAICAQEYGGIAAVLPGREKILKKLSEHAPQFLPIFKEAYEVFIKKEKEFSNDPSVIRFIHGDAHPENVIRVGAKKTTFIDFADMGLSDFARDLGSFMQQLDYMSERHGCDENNIQELKNIFLENYLKSSKIKLDNNLQERIGLYYYFTAMRSAIYMATKNYREFDQAEILINKFKNYIRKYAD